MLKIASLLLQKNAITYDKEEFAFQIQSHPSYPSLHSITGVLDHFGIENVAAKVPVIEDTIAQLPNSFIAQLNDDTGLNLFLIEKSNKGYVTYDSETKKTTLTKEQFLQKFTGIILAVDKDASSEFEPTSSTNKNLIGQVSVFLLTASLFVLFFNSTINIIIHFFLLLTIVGIFISIAIVKQELGVKNTIGDAFCSSDSEKKDCNSVLTSSGASILRNYKLSDFSIIYFTSLGIGTFLLSLQELSINLLLLISLLSIPITVYSIYYQAVVLKKWCLLCLSIVGILWVQTLLLFFYQEFQIGFNLLETLTVASSFLLIFSIWSFLKPKYKEALENQNLKIEYYKFKRNYNLFSTALKKQSAINTSISNVPEIIFGNKKSNLEIVIVTNPFCGHCRPVHKMIERILHSYQNQVKVVIRFNINTENKENPAFKVTTNLFRIFIQKGEEACLLAMSEIYDSMPTEEWLTKWDDVINEELYLKTFNQQNEWCRTHKINFTPAILVNGYSFPKEYDREDLLLFIDELDEEHNLNQVNNETDEA